MPARIGSGLSFVCDFNMLGTTRAAFPHAAQAHRVTPNWEEPMGEHGAICRLGVFYDGSFFSYAQNYYYHERQVGWLRFPEFHHFLEKWIGLREQGFFASYKVVYAAWHQGLFTSKDATLEQLKRDRNRHHDLMHAGVEPKYLPMSQTQGEKGVDVALAVDALQVGLGRMIDVAVLVTGDATSFHWFGR